MRLAGASDIWEEISRIYYLKAIEVQCCVIFHKAQFYSDPLQQGLVLIFAPFFLVSVHIILLSISQCPFSVITYFGFIKQHPLDFVKRQIKFPWVLNCPLSIFSI